MASPQQFSLWTRHLPACPAGAQDCWETRVFPNNLFTRDHAFRMASTRFTTLEAWFTTLEAWFTTLEAWFTTPAAWSRESDAIMKISG